MESSAAMARKGSPVTRERLQHRAYVPYLFLAPYLVLSAVFFLYPFVNALRLAFYQTNGPKSRVFVGLGNFEFLLRDSTFRTALWNTTVFAAASVFCSSRSRWGSRFC